MSMYILTKYFSPGGDTPKHGAHDPEMGVSQHDPYGIPIGCPPPSFGKSPTGREALEMAKDMVASAPA